MWCSGCKCMLSVHPRHLLSAQQLSRSEWSINIFKKKMKSNRQNNMIPSSLLLVFTLPVNNRLYQSPWNLKAFFKVIPHCFFVWLFAFPLPHFITIFSLLFLHQTHTYLKCTPKQFFCYFSFSSPSHFLRWPSYHFHIWGWIWRALFAKNLYAFSSWNLPPKRKLSRHNQHDKS